MAAASALCLCFGSCFSNLPLLWQLLQHSAAALAAASVLCRCFGSCFSTLPLLWQLLQHSAAALAAVVASALCRCFGSCRCFSTLTLLQHSAAALAAVVASALCRCFGTIGPTALITQFALSSSYHSLCYIPPSLFLLYFSLTKKILYRKRGKAKECGGESDKLG